MNTEHTPGPWVASLDCDANGWSMWLIGAPVSEAAPAQAPRHIGYAYCEANARLIAAAPDLLAALRSATFALESAVMLAGLHTLAEPAANARAALNRFYGEETNA